MRSTQLTIELPLRRALAFAAHQVVHLDRPLASPAADRDLRVALLLAVPDKLPGVLGAPQQLRTLCL